MTAYQKDRDDPHWVMTDNLEMVDVCMTPVHADAYQRWLRANGLHLFLIPDSDVHAIGVRDERWEKFT
jgi:hypothetical protein